MLGPGSSGGSSRSTKTGRNGVPAVVGGLRERRAPVCLTVLIALIATALVVVSVGREARADVYPQPCRSLITGTPVQSSRVEHRRLDGVKFNVLLPPAYHHSRRRYPVLYLLNSAASDQDEYLSATDLIQFTGRLPDSQQVIVVLPFGGHLGFYSDWRDGSQHWETFHIRRLMPFVRAHYRTLGDRAHSAVAGFSMGGFGAMSYAARHPELFAAAASFSGELEPRLLTPPPRGLDIPSFATLINEVCGEHLNANGLWGPLASDEIWWRDHSPVDLATNLRATSLYMAVGNGVPCRPADLENPFVQSLEIEANDGTRRFDAALRRVHIAHRTNFYGCGVHIERYVQRDIHAWWPVMLAIFRHPPRLPAAFDYRSADPSFSAWGWNFLADPRRAPEFLDIRNASRRGLTLTGSGATTVTTAALFRPGQRIEISARHGSLVVAANHQGVITFAVRLGKPHALQQYTPAATALERRGHYFITSTVRFIPQSARQHG